MYEARDKGGILSNTNLRASVRHHIMYRSNDLIY